VAEVMTVLQRRHHRRGQRDRGTFKHATDNTVDSPYAFSLLDDL